MPSVLGRQGIGTSFFRMIERFAGSLLVVLLVTVLIIIAARQVGWSAAWAYDLARWAMIWLVFFGMIALSGREQHLKIEIPMDRLPPKLTIFFNVLVAAATAGFGILIAYYGYLEVVRMYQFDERSMSGHFPAFAGYAILPLAFTLLVVTALGLMIKHLSKIRPW